ncbi:hypothetical protein E2C01_001372 [Portunus trituberculatus]|uniref:Uncharacterized protein n=1 Tax=Portunus trituberculatus TaxID=210409 RepID=A0A5B7CHF9_PORTR|nr:hypothetical protein [Portunus trituberculatus]
MVGVGEGDRKPRITRSKLQYFTINYSCQVNGGGEAVSVVTASSGRQVTFLTLVIMGKHFPVSPPDTLPGRKEQGFSAL